MTENEEIIEKLMLQILLQEAERNDIYLNCEEIIRDENVKRNL